MLQGPRSGGRGFGERRLPDAFTGLWPGQCIRDRVEKRSSVRGARRTRRLPLTEAADHGSLGVHGSCRPWGLGQVSLGRGGPLSVLRRRRGARPRRQPQNSPVDEVPSEEGHPTPPRQTNQPRPSYPRRLRFFRGSPPDDPPSPFPLLGGGSSPSSTASTSIASGSDGSI